MRKLLAIIIRGNRVVHNKSVYIVGRGGALVESMLFERRIVGSNPALAAT